MAVRLPCNSLPGTFRVPAAKRKARVRSTGSHLGPNTTSGRLRIRMCYPALFGGRQTAEGSPPSNASLEVTRLMGREALTNLAGVGLTLSGS